MLSAHGSRFTVQRQVSALIGVYLRFHVFGVNLEYDCETQEIGRE
jgi:hypothetical protein